MMTDDKNESSVREELAGLPVREFDPQLLDQVVLRASQRRRQRRMLGGAVALAATMVAAGVWLPGPDLQYNQTLATPSHSSAAAPSSAPPSGSASPAASAEPSATAGADAPTEPEASATAVVTSEFHTTGGSGTGYYFSDPADSLRCALTEDGTVGCQATVVVSGMAACGTDPDSSAAMVGWQRGDGLATAECTSQGIFVRSDGQANAVLPYGSVLTLAGNHCESGPDGISCAPDGTNGGFTISQAGIRIGSGAGHEVLVDAAPFQAEGSLGAGAYYFVSHDQSVVCGIGAGEVGCQALVPVDGMERCGTDPEVSTAMVAWYGSGSATSDCTTQGLFMAEPYASGADTAHGMRLLPEGATLAAHGVQCRSDAATITCRFPGGSFSISPAGIQTAG